MNGNEFEQFVAQMMTSVKSSTDWLKENQRREETALDQKLAAAQQVLQRALEFVISERTRLRGGDKQPAEQGQLRQLHDQLETRAERAAIGPTRRAPSSTGNQ